MEILLEEVKLRNKSNKKETSSQLGTIHRDQLEKTKKNTNTDFRQSRGRQKNLTLKGRKVQ
jgi:hypothetical protein